MLLAGSAGSSATSQGPPIPLCTNLLPNGRHKLDGTVFPISMSDASRWTRLGRGDAFPPGRPGAGRSAPRGPSVGKTNIKSLHFYGSGTQCRRALWTKEKDPEGSVYMKDDRADGASRVGRVWGREGEKGRRLLWWTRLLWGMSPEAGIHPVFVYSPIYIRSGSRALPIALIASIAVIHSYQLGIFFCSLFIFVLISTLVEILVPNKKLDSSKL